MMESGDVGPRSAEIRFVSIIIIAIALFTMIMYRWIWYGWDAMVKYEYCRNTALINNEVLF